MGDRHFPDIERPAIGSLYRHHSGAVYEVTKISNDNDGDTPKPEFLPTVSFENIVNRKAYTRPLDQFVEKFTPIPQNQWKPFIDLNTNNKENEEADWKNLHSSLLRWANRHMDQFEKVKFDSDYGTVYFSLMLSDPFPESFEKIENV